MLLKDFASSSANIMRANRPDITAPVQPDWAGIIRQAGKDYQTGKQLQADNALTEQLIAENPDDEAKIRQMGGRAYADALKADAERAEERQWKLDDMQAQRDFNKELVQLQLEKALALENVRNANARSLAEFKASLGGENTPNAIQVVKAMVDSGIPEQDAWALYYAGQNPNVPTEIFGKKGGEKASEALGKNYAADMEEYNNMMSKLPELEETVKKLNDLGKTATYTTAGKLIDAFRKETGMPARQSAQDRAAYVAMIDNQILPLLRDTFGAQFTEREGNTLRKTLGDANATPEEKKAQLDAFIRQKRKSIESKQRKIQSYTQPSLAQFQTPVEQTPVDYKSKYGLE